MPAPRKQFSPIDENVKIPAAVKAGIARAEAAQAEFLKNVTAEQPPADAPPPVPPIEVPPETPPETPPVAAVPPVEAPVTPPGNDPWEHRYNSMKGRYDRSQAQIRELGEQVTNLQKVLATQTAPAPAAATPVARLVTAQEETEYGQEFLDVVGRRAEERIRPMVAAFEAKIAGLESQVSKVGGSVQIDARSRMFSGLDQSVPDWRTVNTNSEFLAWLALPDAYSGVIRQELLSAAFERNDTPRVLAFFNGFLAEEAAVAPTPRVPDEPPGSAPTEPTGKVPLEALAAPGRARSAAGGNAPVEKPTVTRAQITQFYVDAANGKYRGREDEYKRIEAAIFAAQGAGRIR